MISPTVSRRDRCVCLCAVSFELVQQSHRPGHASVHESLILASVFSFDQPTAAVRCSPESRQNILSSRCSSHCTSVSRRSMCSCTHLIHTTPLTTLKRTHVCLCQKTSIHVVSYYMHQVILFQFRNPLYTIMCYTSAESIMYAGCPSGCPYGF